MIHNAAILCTLRCGEISNATAKVLLPRKDCSSEVYMGVERLDMLILPDVRTLEMGDLHL